MGHTVDYSRRAFLTATAPHCAVHKHTRNGRRVIVVANYTWRLTLAGAKRNAPPAARRPRRKGCELPEPA